MTRASVGTSVARPAYRFLVPLWGLCRKEAFLCLPESGAGSPEAFDKPLRRPYYPGFGDGVWRGHETGSAWFLGV